MYLDTEITFNAFLLKEVCTKFMQHMMWFNSSQDEEVMISTSYSNLAEIQINSMEGGLLNTFSPSLI
jgi:hypothetical protein